MALFSPLDYILGGHYWPTPARTEQPTAHRKLFHLVTRANSQSVAPYQWASNVRTALADIGSKLVLTEAQILALRLYLAAFAINPEKYYPLLTFIADLLGAEVKNQDTDLAMRQALVQQLNPPFPLDAGCARFLAVVGATETARKQHWRRLYASSTLPSIDELRAFLAEAPQPFLWQELQSAKKERKRQRPRRAA